MQYFLCRNRLFLVDFSHNEVEKLYKRIKACGQDGVFIPLESFEKGLFLDESQKLSLQEKIRENDKLIQSLKEDLDVEGDA